jgi:hypothetical protein
MVEPRLASTDQHLHTRASGDCHMVANRGEYTVSNDTIEDSRHLFGVVFSITIFGVKESACECHFDSSYIRLRR